MLLFRLTLRTCRVALGCYLIVLYSGTQGHREKFRAPGQKFRLGPLVSGAPKPRDEQKKVIASADVQISAQNQVMSKRRVIASADVQISAQHLVMSKIRS